MDVYDTLVLILERIDSAATLIRAASTCRRWRRVIADAGFLRRYRCLHGPPVAGDYYNGYPTHGRHTASFVLSSSSIGVRHFSLHFLVDVNIFESWIMDSRGSLLMMDCISRTPNTGAFPVLVVCEPLTQRYKIIPRPSGFNSPDCEFRGTYLVDGDGDEDEAGGRIGMSNFRVLCVFRSRYDEVARTTVFTVGSGDTDSTWSEEAMDHIASRLVRPNIKARHLGRALGSSYFYIQQDGTLITRDGSTGKFSSSLLSQDIRNYWDGHDSAQNFSVVDGGDGEPRIVTVTDHTLVVFARVDGEWGLENKVLLSKVTRGLPGYQPSFFGKPLTIMRGGVGFVVVSPREPKQQWPFSIDLKTMEVALTPATEGSSERMATMAYPCEFPWPPVLQVCLDR